jgi:acyl-CoA thioesterase-1
MADDSTTRAKSRRLVSLVVLAMMAGTISADAGSTLQIVALGTSLTARGGWSQPLAEALGQCEKRQVMMTVVARPGATSSWGRERVDQVLGADPDLVLIEFAVNDSALQNFVTLGESTRNISAIISALNAHSRPPRIYLMAMNPVHGAKAWLRPSLAAYEEAHRAVADEQGAGFIDTRPAWTRLGEDERQRLIPDGLHPDPREDASIVVPTLIAGLAGTKCRWAEAQPWRH